MCSDLYSSRSASRGPHQRLPDQQAPFAEAVSEIEIEVIIDIRAHHHNGFIIAPSKILIF